MEISHYYCVYYMEYLWAFFYFLQWNLVLVVYSVIVDFLFVMNLRVARVEQPRMNKNNIYMEKP